MASPKRINFRKISKRPLPPPPLIISNTQMPYLWHFESLGSGRKRVISTVSREMIITTFCSFKSLPIIVTYRVCTATIPLKQHWAKSSLLFLTITIVFLLVWTSDCLPNLNQVQRMSLQNELLRYSAKSIKRLIWKIVLYCGIGLGLETNRFSWQLFSNVLGLPKMVDS